MKLLRAASFLSAVTALQDEPAGYSLVSNYSMDLLKEGASGSKLFEMKVEALGDGTTFFLDLHGDSRFDLGYEQASIVGDKMIACYDAMLEWMTGGVAPLKQLVQEFLIWQWDIALSKQTPSDYLEELRGMTAASTDLNFSADVGALAAAGIVLSNFPGSADDIIYVFINEFKNRDGSRFSVEASLTRDLRTLIWSDGEGGTAPASADVSADIVERALRTKVRWPSTGCSNFGVWGTRTEGSALFSGRNLDYESDTGINNYKLVTVYHPPEAGRIAHATVGFAGLVGALTGMSAAGVTVHEANLESNKDTFLGFPWVLRLRDVMERASSLDEALALWGTANNTVGFNHAVGSGKSEADGSPQFAALETDAEHTAVFFDMDEREANGVNGAPRPQAVFRTNHGFDPETVAHYTWNGTGADANSQARYALYPQLFDAYGEDSGAINHVEAVRIAAVLASKSNPTEYDAYVCDPEHYDSADNVLSVAFSPTQDALYAAWEVGTGDAWAPAACTTYVYVDLAPWW